MLTMFHATEFQSKIDKLSSIDEGLKSQMRQQVDEFTSALFALAKFNPLDSTASTKLQEQARLARQAAC